MRIHASHLIVVALAASILSGPAVGQATHQLTIEKPLFGSYRYTYGNAEPQKIFTPIGLSFTDEFEEVLSQEPAALREARKAHMYKGISLAGNLTMVAGSVLLLVNTLDDAAAVSDDRLPESSTDLRPLGLVIAGAALASIGAILSKHKLRAGIRLFNERHGRTAERLNRSSIEIVLRPQFTDVRPGMRLTVRGF